jgi:serine/threonine protein kinase
VVEGPVDFGRYELTELLARGGMAELYRARARGLSGFEKVLVIKRILPELVDNPRFVDMFVNEAKIAVALSHPNIVQVFDLGEEEGTTFIAMEYVPGTDLGIVIERLRGLGRRMPWPLAAFVGAEVAKALDYAHRRRDDSLEPLRIVHRDVSPQNVLLGWEGEVKLTDFGVAKARLAAQEVTDVGMVKGKYAYMAPEQANGGDVDHRADLFSLGALLYEAIAGRNPFVGRSTYETLRRVRRGLAPPLATMAPDLPEDVATLVDEMLHPRPERRPPSAGRFFEAWTRRLHQQGVRIGSSDLAAFLAALSEQKVFEAGTSHHGPSPEETTKPGRSQRPAAGLGEDPPRRAEGEGGAGAPGRRQLPPVTRATPGSASQNDPPDAALLARRVDGMLSSGEHTEALTTLARLIGPAGPGARSAAGELLRARALVACRRFPDAEASLAEAAALARSDPSPAVDDGTQHELRLVAAELDLGRGRPRASRRALEGLSIDPERQPRLEARRLLALAEAAVMVGDDEAAEGHLHAHAALVDRGRRIPPSELAAARLAREGVAFLVHLHRGRLGLATSTAERGIEDAWALDRRYDALRFAHHLGELHLRTGGDRRAFGYLRTSYELAREAGLGALEWANLRALGCLDAVRFQADEGRAQILRAVDDAQGREDRIEEVAGWTSGGHAAYALGRPEEAATLFAAARDRAEAQGLARAGAAAAQALDDLQAGRPPNFDW